MKYAVLASISLSVVTTTHADQFSNRIDEPGLRKWTIHIDYPAAPDRSGTVTAYDVAGRQSFDGPGAPNNELITFNVAAALDLPAGTDLLMTGAGWNVDIEAFGTSWLSEPGVSFAPTGGKAEIFVRPGAGDNFPGIGSYNSAVVKFSSIPLPDISLPDGVVIPEFFESFDDVPGSADGRWINGTLSLQFVENPPLLGDMDCNGFVNVGDIGGFVLSLTNPAQYAIQFPDCEINLGDINQNGFVEIGDIGPFVLLLTML